MSDRANGQGHVAAAISNRLVALQREFYGRGPTKAKTTVDGDLVVCVMGDIYISAERTLIDSGRFEAVRHNRSAFNDAMAPQLKKAVEDLTGRRVTAFVSQTHADPDLAVEVFILGDAVDGAATDADTSEVSALSGDRG